MFQFSLHVNHLTEGENDYRAVTQSLESYKIEQIIGQMTGRGSILKDTECEAVIHDFFRVIGENLARGIGFTSEYFRIFPTIAGKFDHKSDDFDPERHKKSINMSAGQYFKEITDAISVKKVNPNVSLPEIAEITDVVTQVSNTWIKPGHTLKITGETLKLNADEKDEGVFFVHSKSGKEFKASVIDENIPSRLSVVVPKEIPDGDYIIKVRNRPRNVKELREGAFDGTLVVNRKG